MSAAGVAKRVDNERLNSLAQQFRVWQIRDKNSIFKMPSYLWEDAFDFVDVLGLSRVARELGVHRDELNRRMAEARAAVESTARPPHSEPEAQSAAKPMPFLDLELDIPKGLTFPPEQDGVAESPPPMEPATDPIPASPVTEVVGAVAGSAPTRSPAITDNRPAVSSAEEAFLEVLDTDGAKLSIRIPVTHLMNASALIRDFRSRP